MQKDHYVTLGVPRNASIEEIREAYLRLALKVHPDKNPNSERTATAHMQKIAQAWEILSDEVKRRSYDEALEKTNIAKVDVNETESTDMKTRYDQGNRESFEINREVSGLTEEKLEILMYLAKHQPIVFKLQNILKFGARSIYVVLPISMLFISIDIGLQTLGAIGVVTSLLSVILGRSYILVRTSILRSKLLPKLRRLEEIDQILRNLRARKSGR